MKISRIQIDGILGISSVDIKPAAPIQLFAGLNHSGKSSIRDSIMLAIGGENEVARDVTKKKEFAALVHDGAQQGGALITMDDDADKSFAFNMPDGKFTGMEIPDAMRVALNGQRFATMTIDERRTFLFDLTKCKPNGTRLKEIMLKRGCNAAKIDAVLPLGRAGGFPSMCEHAKSKATEAKGAWRAITGGTYGPVAAPKWAAAMPEAPDEGKAAALETRLNELATSIATMTEALGTFKTIQRTDTENAEKRTSLKATVDKIPDLEDQLKRAQADLAAYLPKVEAMRARAGGPARIGLVHDMATYINGLHETSTSDDDDAFELLKRYQSEHGPLGAKVDTEAQAALPEHEKGLTVMQNRVTNLQRDLDSAKQVKGQYDALAAAEAVEDLTGEIEATAANIARAAEEQKKTRDLLTRIYAALKDRTDAAKKTANALAHHENVVAWTVVADALAPDGIPAEILASALKPVNDALEQAAVDTDWKQVAISDNMDITAGGRPRRMLSKSEQWCTDAMFAEVVAELSGLKILMLDEFDILDLPGRAEALNWLDALVDCGVIETALLFATLKAKPEGLADTIETHWVENGAIAGAEQRAAA